MIKDVFLPYLSDRMPKLVAPKNLPSETAVATVVRQKLFSQIKSHWKKIGGDNIRIINNNKIIKI